MMKTFEIEDKDGLVEIWVQVDRGNGEYTSMLKSTYDEQQANQNNPVGGN